MSRIVFLLALACSPASADSPALTPQELEPSVVAVVAGLLETYHYQGVSFDDDLSERWLSRYIDNLDPSRLFFLQSDVDEFLTWSALLDDDLRAQAPRLNKATVIYERFQSRVYERTSAAQRILGEPIDLTGDETWAIDRSEAPWPADVAAADDLWRLRVWEQVLQGDLQERERERTLEILTTRYKRLADDMGDMESGDVLETWLTSLAQTLDPHSSYYKPASRDNFDIEMSNSVEGIGASLRKINEYTVVQELIAGGPAELDGQLQPNDKIIAVAQGEAEPVDVVDLRIDGVVKLIRGEKGTEVRLTVIPADATGESEAKVIGIIRDKVILTQSDAEATVHEVGDHKVGVIELPSFYWDGKDTGKSAARDTERLLVDLKEQEADVVVLDLRTNGGGSLHEAMALAGLFVKTGPVVQIKERSGRIQAGDDPDPSLVWPGPVVVLTSPLSASASEIVAGAIQDYDRGLVVGSAKTHGKGTVQTAVDLTPMLRDITQHNDVQSVAGMLKLTTQKFYRVSGGSTQSRGVISDIILPSPWDGIENIYESDLPNALPWDEIDEKKHKDYDQASVHVEALKTASSERVASDEAFARIKKAIDEREAFNRRTSVMLNLDQRKQELEESKAKIGDEPELEEGEEAPDPILDEAIRIAADYAGRWG